MASKYLDTTPPVAAALKAGTPIVAIETGFFMRLPYPRNLAALQACEEAFWRRGCVPCCVAAVNGRLKAGLTKEDMETLCRAGGSCSRWELPSLVGGGGTAAAGASAAAGAAATGAAVAAGAEEPQAASARTMTTVRSRAVSFFIFCSSLMDT